jgi:hypothetical protein
MSELRDLYAGLAMHAMLMFDKHTNIYGIAHQAFEVADIMMEEHGQRAAKEADAADGKVG